MSTPRPDFDRLLDEALDALAAGQAPAAIAARYAAPIFPARTAERLLPLLQAAQLAAVGLGDPLPAPDLARGRRRFLAEAAARPRPRPHSPAWLRPAWAPALLVAMIALAALLVPAASAAALPGELLYPVKRLVEEARLALAAPPQRSSLHAELAERRREEAARLLALGREARLVFEGTVEETGANRLVVSSLAVLSPRAGEFNLGDRVAVEGTTTQGGTITAARLTLLAAAPTRPAPLPSVTPTPEATRPRPATTPTRPARPSATASPRVARPSATATSPPARPSETATLAPATRPPTETAPPPTDRPAEARPTERQRP